MKIIKQVPVIEVKRAFVISDIGKIKGNARGVSEKIFIKKLNDAKKKVLKWNESMLDRHIEWPKRLAAYTDSVWYIAKISPVELGVWRRASGMPLRWTNKTLVQTSENIKKALENNSKFLKKRSRYAIYNILHSPEQLSQKEKYSFPIVFKNDTGTHGRSYLRTKTKADIDDGCMRSIAMAMSGRNPITVYFGIPRKSILK